jgi:hypothetical protein
MTISDLIRLLEDLEEHYGDLPVEDKSGAEIDDYILVEKDDTTEVVAVKLLA